MTIVDLVKARAHANSLPHAMTATAVWIEDLADEVESQDRTIRELRAMVADVEADAAKTQDERDAALTALAEILGTITTILPRV